MSARDVGNAPRSGQKRRLVSIGRKVDKSITPPAQSQSLDLKVAIDAARRTFRQDIKNSTSSTPASLSPKTSSTSTIQVGKSNSAPVSPTKVSDSTMTNGKMSTEKGVKPLGKTPKRMRRSATNLPQLDIKIDSENSLPLLKIDTNSKEAANPSKKKVPSPKSSTDKKSNDFSNDPKRRPSNNVSMNEVIKLHQDGGVMHLLHALPSSRRKLTHMVSIVARRPSANGPESSQPSQPSSGPALNYQAPQKQTNIVASTNVIVQSKKVLQPRQTNHVNGEVTRPVVKPCTQDELMTQYALEKIKQLPSKEYLRLWSTPAKYSYVSEPDVMVTVQTTNPNPGPGPTSSPSSSVSSDMSSVSNSRPQASTQVVHLKPVVPWTINTKHYKDILIRPYKTFAQVIMSPVTTGLKNSLNCNVIEELTDALRQLANEPECRSVLITGIGQTFCQGVDLTILTYDSADRQRRSAENLAGSIKKFITYLLAYPKILIAAVNGTARGAGVTLLPYFDLVYASDKATFSADYAKLGQIPEAFPSHSVAGGHLSLNEILLFCKTVTASEAVNYGIVSSVVWPDKFLEEIVPRVEMLESMSLTGLKCIKSNMKQSLKKSVTQAVMDDETKSLIQNWTSPVFAKTARAYLKNNRLLF